MRTPTMLDRASDERSAAADTVKLATAGRVRSRLASLRVRPSALRIWLYVLVLAALAVAGFVTIVAGLKDLGSPFHIPWPVLAVGFFAAEAKALAVHFRRETHSFSLSEIAVVIGLFFCQPAEYAAALLVGSALALVLVARQSPVKLAFNLANSALMIVVQLSVFRAIAQAGGTPSFDDWIAAFVSTMTVAILTAMSVSIAITLSGGASQFPKLPEMLKFATVSAIANTSLGLLAVSVLWTDPAEVWLLIGPIGVLVVAYRAYISEREKHERLELLYQSSRILQHSPELESALVALLVHARDMFRAQIAELVLYPGGGGAAPALRTTSLADARADVMVPIAPGDEPFRAEVARERGAFFATPAARFERGGLRVRRALVCPLIAESGLIGSLMVANRLTEGTSFDEDERRLLETIANQTAVALANDQLEQSLAELSRLKEQLRYQAYHDPLTGLANRTMFAVRVSEQLTSLRPMQVCAVLFLDLDDFKLVNDTLGHAAGDRLLAAVAARIRGCIRSDDLAARLGGDEFAVLLTDNDDLERSTRVAARIVEVLQTPLTLEGQDLFVGASIGIAVGRAPDVTEELLRNADVAMYTAKAAGKRRVAVFDPTMHAAIVARHGLSAELSRSIGRGELLVHYQPIVTLEGRRVIASEALVRWNHPTRGIISPDDFIPLAEENGAILALGHWVLAEACRQAASWLRQGCVAPDFAISVNLSPLQVQQEEFATEIETVLGVTGLPPQRLILEITETAMFQDAQGTTLKLDELRARGVRIAVDDFGTGYSSLSYLHRFPIDILKIARDFIVRTDETDAGGISPDGQSSEWAFTHAIVALGRTLGLEVVAEGIEQPGQVERLQQLGCEIGQGYFLGRPVPAERFLEQFGRSGSTVPTSS